jgi:hypothetical protein
MLKITDATGTINEAIPTELAKCVGVWADMVGSEHSKDEDERVYLLFERS